MVERALWRAPESPNSIQPKMSGPNTAAASAAAGGLLPARERRDRAADRSGTGLLPSPRSPAGRVLPNTAGGMVDGRRLVSQPSEWRRQSTRTSRPLRVRRLHRARVPPLTRCFPSPRHACCAVCVCWTSSSQSSAAGWHWPRLPIPHASSRRPRASSTVHLLRADRVFYGASSPAWSGRLVLGPSTMEGCGGEFSAGCVCLLLCSAARCALAPRPSFTTSSERARLCSERSAGLCLLILR